MKKQWDYVENQEEKEQFYGAQRNNWIQREERAIIYRIKRKVIYGNIKKRVRLKNESPSDGFFERKCLPKYY